MVNQVTEDGGDNDPDNKGSSDPLFVSPLIAFPHARQKVITVLLAISFSQSEHSQDLGNSMIHNHCAVFWQTHNNATAPCSAGILPADLPLPIT